MEFADISSRNPYGPYLCMFSSLTNFWPIGVSPDCCHVTVLLCQRVDQLRQDFVSDHLRCSGWWMLVQISWVSTCFPRFFPNVLSVFHMFPILCPCFHIFQEISHWCPYFPSLSAFFSLIPFPLWNPPMVLGGPLNMWCHPHHPLLNNGFWVLYAC